MEVMKDLDYITDSALRGEGETEREFSMLCLVSKTFFINAVVIVSSKTKFCVHVFLIDLVAVEKVSGNVGLYEPVRIRVSERSLFVYCNYFRNNFLFLVGMRVGSVSMEQTIYF